MVGLEGEGARSSGQRLECRRVLFRSFFFFKQKTAYEIGTGDWSSDVCSSDLNEKWAVQKAGVLPQRELVSIKSAGAAATRNGQDKKRGAAATRNGQFKSWGAAATKTGQY